MQPARAIAMILVLGLTAGPGAQAETARRQAEPELPHAFDAGWRGQKTCELIYSSDALRVGRCVFPPGTGHEKHYHDPHFGYVLEGGSLRIEDDEGVREVTTQSGGSWSTAGVTVHQALNIGDTTTSYLIVEPVQ